MNAMTNFTVRSLRANRVRTLVTVVGVALAAALLTAVLTSYTSLLSMLYHTEESASGTWMAVVQSNDRADLDTKLAAARDAGDIAEVATLQDAGFGELTGEQQDFAGVYLPLVSIAGDVDALCAVRPCEGRLPQAAGEIMLFDTWRAEKGLALGDTLTLPVGRRVAELAPGEEGTVSGGSIAASESSIEEHNAGEYEWMIEDGSELDSRMGYFDAEADGGIFNERLVDAQERTYTVVGFYDAVSYAASQSTGMTGFVCDDAEAGGLTRAFVTMEGVSSTDEVQERIEAAFPGETFELHTSMLRYMGVRTEGVIWDTFFGIVAVLAVVITVACVSLIYNAFAISVAERAGQFGLLSSVGASRRQLRRAVLVEALIVAALGVPLGLVVGIGGCAATFAVLGPAIASLVGGEGTFAVVVAPWALAVAAVLTVATVLVSAFVPAWRASRMNVIDALRTSQGVRASRRGQARARRAADPGRLWRRRGIAGRVFGVGGMLARINEKRGTSKSAAASVSLALAIVLLMTAGSLSTFLGTLVNVAGGETDMPDVTVMAALTTPEAAEAGDAGEDADAEAAGDAGGDVGAGDAGTAAEGGAAGDTAASAAGDATASASASGDTRANGGTAGDAAASASASTPATTAAPSPTVQVVNEDFAAQAAVYAKVYEALGKVPGAAPVNWSMGGTVPISVPEEMAGAALRQGDTRDAHLMDDGRYGIEAALTYLDDDVFDQFAADQGLNAADYHDPAHPRVIGVADAYGNDGSIYQLLEVLSDTGEAEAIVGGIYRGEPVSGFGLCYRQDENGKARFMWEPYLEYVDEDDSSTMEAVDPDQVEIETAPLEVAALVHEVPRGIGGIGETLRLIAPASLAATQSFGIKEPGFQAAFDAPEGNHGEVAQALVDRAGAFFHSETDYETTYLSMSDNADMMESNQMLVLVVNVFCLLFTVILALIAMANVFNTVTNGLILRRREFAVMKSVGLSIRQFRRMIVDECAAWCVRGLVPGIALSVVVSWLLFRMVGLSMSGLSFTLPWTYVALAFALTGVAVAASVAYGMHRCKADNVVEALRADGV